MDIKTLKLDLLEKIIKTETPSILFEIEKLLQKEKSSDWWYSLPYEVKESIIEGMNDLEEGKTLPHDQIIQEAKQKYGF